MDVPSCPDMSVAKFVSVDLGTFMSVEFDDRVRKIQATDDNPIGAYQHFQNPSLAPNVGRAMLRLKLKTNSLKFRSTMSFSIKN